MSISSQLVSVAGWIQEQIDLILNNNKIPGKIERNTYGTVKVAEAVNGKWCGQLGEKAKTPKLCAFAMALKMEESERAEERKCVQ